MSAPVDPLDPQRLYAEVRATIDGLPVNGKPLNVTTSLERLCRAATLQLELMGSAVT